jgi:hypothetical protein
MAADAIQTDSACSILGRERGEGGGVEGRGGRGGKVVSCVMMYPV